MSEQSDDTTVRRERPLAPQTAPQTAASPSWAPPAAPQASPTPQPTPAPAAQSPAPPAASQAAPQPAPAVVQSAPSAAPAPAPTAAPWQNVTAARQRPPREILTLPPIDELIPPIPLSEATGQPRRDTTMLVGMGLLHASSAAALVGAAKVWWTMMHMHTYAQSAKLVQWTEAVSWTKEGIALGVVVTLISLAMITAPAVAAFNAWNGHRWSRWAAVVATVVSLLAITLGPWSWAAIPLALAGTVVLFLPAVSRYFHHWAVFRTPPVEQGRLPEHVLYGPEPRFR